MWSSTYSPCVIMCNRGAQRGPSSTATAGSPRESRSPKEQEESVARDLLTGVGRGEAKRNHGGRCGSQQDLRVQSGECPLPFCGDGSRSSLDRGNWDGHTAARRPSRAIFVVSNPGTPSKCRSRASCRCVAFRGATLISCKRW